MEVWKNITYAPKYDVSNLGRIRNTITKRIKSAKRTPSHRHPQVHLYTRIGKIQLTLSRIVFDHFCADNGERITRKTPYANKVKHNRIGHIDGNINNNKENNLYRY